MELLITLNPWLFQIRYAYRRVNKSHLKTNNIATDYTKVTLVTSKTIQGQLTVSVFLNLSLTSRTEPFEICYATLSIIS